MPIGCRRKALAFKSRARSTITGTVRGTKRGGPTRFTTADQLLVDFETEVDRVLAELGIDSTVIGTSDVTERRSR